MTDSLVGRTIAGRFAIESQIGAGSIGVVYKARRLPLNEFVAVKVLRRSVTRHEAFAERFYAEAAAVSQLDHPNIVRVIDVDEVADGLAYVAMEFVDGAELIEKVQVQWPISNERIVDLLSQTLDAIATGHDAGIIHGNLKPTNILVVSARDGDGRHDLVKVCDFGTAKFSTTDQPPPKSGEVGKNGGLTLDMPEYMSPEHFKREPLDARSDVYSVGVILFQLLAGRVPFTGDTAVEVALKQSYEQPRFPAHILARVSPKLEAVCLRALRKRPEDRYATAQEMRTDLRAAVKGALTDVSRTDEKKARIVNLPPPRLPPRQALAATSVAPTAMTTPKARGRDVWMPIVFTIALGVCAGAYVIGAKRNAGSGTVAMATEHPSETPAPSATAAPPNLASQDFAPKLPAAQNPVPQHLDSPQVLEPPVVEIIRKSSRRKSGHSATRPATYAADGRPSSLATPPAPIAGEPPPTASAPPMAATAPTPPPSPATPPSRPEARVDPGNARVSWKVAGVAGGATAGDVARAIDHITGSWNECYQSGLRARSSNVEGSATLRLSCDDQGRVVGATVSGLDMPEVAACIRAKSMGITIPNADTGEASANVMLSFAVRH